MLSKSIAVQATTLGLVRYPATGTAGAAAAYVVDMPDKPDTAVCFYERPSFPPDADLSGYEYPEIQVIVRTDKAAGHEAGYALAERIRLAFKDTAAQRWAAGTEYERDIFACDANESAPLALDPSNGRPRWSVSFQIHALQEVTP